jgi:hypothetical protein
MRNLVSLLKDLYRDLLSLIFLSLHSNGGKRVLILIRGVPGSGKSWLSEKIAEKWKMQICTTDDFFICPDGQYRFDLSRLGLNHTANIIRTYILASLGKSIIVPNTFSEFWEMRMYARIAQHFGMDVVYITLPHPNDTHKNANSHGVPQDKVDEMQSRMTHPMNMHELVNGSSIPPNRQIDESTYGNALDIAKSTIPNLDEKSVDNTTLRGVLHGVLHGVLRVGLHGRRPR